MLLTIVAAVFVFGLLVLFHELGHFMTAKLTDMRVDEFAIGFGPKLVSVKYGETVYSLRVFPLGGFNRIAGMDGDDDDAGERSYAAKPVASRMLVILAGSIMNFILPILLFWGIYFFSGIHTASTEPILGEVLAHKPAAQAGLLAGDRIVRMNDKDVSSWKDIVEDLQGSEGKVFKVEFERQGEIKATTLIPEYEESSKKAMVGIVASVTTVNPSFTDSFHFAVQNTFNTMYRMIEGLWQIVAGKTAADLAGPIGVAQMAGEIAQIGFVPLLQFAAFLSINLGIINLLPVPALDGGHFVTLLFEAVRGKPLSPKALQYAQVVGFVLLMSLMLFATFKDITR